MATELVTPPKPDHPPTVHQTRKKPRTLKGDLAKLRSKASSGAEKWRNGRSAKTERIDVARREGREVVTSAKEKWAKSKEEGEARREAARDQGREVLRPVREKVEGEGELAADTVRQFTREPLEAARKVVSFAKRGRAKPYVAAFGVASALSWLLSPQLPIALYDRVVLQAGRVLVSPAHDRSVLEAGAGTDWGIMHGPGRWFRDTLRMASETGQVGKFVWAIVIGLLPMAILTIRGIGASYLSQLTYRSPKAETALKWVTRAAYGIPVLYLIGIPYKEETEWAFGSAWTMEWWQIYVAGLFCGAYYCLTWTLDRIGKRLPVGFFGILLLIPAASIISGFLLHAPGAAW